MKKYFVLIVLICIGLVKSTAQPLTSGEVEYRYRIFWAKIYASSEYLSENAKARELMAWGNEEGYSTRMILQFNPEGSIYTKGEPYEKGGYSWNDNDHYLVNNLQDNTSLLYMTAMNKNYLVTGDSRTYKWQVKNELREILGHMCMKATTTDSVKNQDIVAWFAVDIPVSAGPEQIYGLPGLVLRYEVNGDHLIVEAENIIPGEVKRPIELPKKMKGKELTFKEFDEKVMEFIDDSNKMKRTWGWSVRY
ncbi:GLPGLI family protein [Jiulongibacter sp. NS-SX5]|uniref:GLPGLI family protein n=1 Tax=Jiulongibacter sp. NS-SX5 TaxID=3463854 RepID=UPI004059D72D